MMPDDRDAGSVERILAAADGGAAIAPITDDDPAFDVERAYRVLEALHARRVAQGWRPVGRKIGFTNRTLWPRYGVYRPMWSHVWDRTVTHATHDTAEVDVSRLHEPRIEPEIVFGLSAPLAEGADAGAMLASVAWIAAGFEIVHSVFPDWRFRAPDCTAAFGLHGLLVVGTKVPVAPDDRQRFAALLPVFEATLAKGGARIDTGVGANVLDGPAHALAYLRDVLATQPASPPLAAGEIVTTGTLTDAWPVAPGETWTSDYGALLVRGVTLVIR